MNRRSVLSASAVVFGLALVPAVANAQQKSLKEQLVGAWSVVSCDSTSANGAKQPYCTNPNGILILDAATLNCSAGISARFPVVNLGRSRAAITVAYRPPASRMRMPFGLVQ